MSVGPGPLPAATSPPQGWPDALYLPGGCWQVSFHYLLSQTYSFIKVPLKKYENPLSPNQSQLDIKPAAAPSKPIPYARSDSRRQHPNIVTIDWLLFTRQWGPKHMCFNSHILPSLLPIFERSAYPLQHLAVYFTDRGKQVWVKLLMQ